MMLSYELLELLHRSYSLSDEDDYHQVTAD